MHKILDIIHNTIYQFFDVCDDNEEVPISDKDKLLLEVNKAICNNLKALEQEPCDVSDTNVGKTDAVSKKAAIEKIHWLGIDNDTAIMCDLAIRALPSVNPQEPRWTPVSERLPEKDRKHNTFLVTDSNGNLSISKFYLPLSNSDIDKPYWSGMIDVIAWMPLPEPYKAESEDKE